MLHFPIPILTNNVAKPNKPNAVDIIKNLIQYVNYIITFVFSRRKGIVPSGDPRHAYVRKNLREASVKV